MGNSGDLGAQEGSGMHVCLCVCVYIYIYIYIYIYMNDIGNIVDMWAQ